TALPLRLELAERYPDAEYPLSGIGVAYNHTGRPRKTIAALKLQAERTGSPELTALLAEAHLALGEYEQALAWVEIGLERRPDNLRLLQHGFTIAEAREDFCAAESFAAKYLDIDPESASMHFSYGQTLMALEKWNALEKHSSMLLGMNPINQGALEREAARTKALKHERQAWRVERRIIDAFGNDAGQLIRAAVTAAGASDFRYALPALKRIRGLGHNNAVAVLSFPRVEEKPILGAVGLDHVKMQLAELSRWYRPAGIGDLLSPPKESNDWLEKIPLVLLIGRSSPETLAHLDAYLEMCDWRACLVVGVESLREEETIWPNASFLHQLQQTGRWEFAFTDYDPPRLPTNEKGKTTQFWTQTAWHDGRKETPDQMKDRLQTRLATLDHAANETGIEVVAWVHPSWGDYGQRSLRTVGGELRTYMETVTARFPVAFTNSSTGYYIPCGDLSRVPMRVAYSASDPEEFAVNFSQRHPTRRAVLELAKVTSWHGQLPLAETYFAEARPLGLDMKETTYFHARNAQYQGDVPVAKRRAREARQWDPEAERVIDLNRDVSRLTRPRFVLEPRFWTDSNDEEYDEYLATMAMHMNDKWELFMLGGHHRWADPDSSISGFSLGVGARHYFRRGHWLQGDFRRFFIYYQGDFEGSKDYNAGSVSWHGNYVLPFRDGNGDFTFSYNREGVEARKAQDARIRANRYAFNSTTRLNNWWEVDFNAYYTNRTDSNDTWGFGFRPTYRIFERPIVRIGYWLLAADSDVNPDEYYAPVKYQAHQAVMLFRHQLHPRFALTGLAAYGKARAGETGWRTVMRFNAGVSWRLTDCLGAAANYNYLKLPDYTLRQYGFSLDLRF
ncbi:MAG: hypothetical protein LIP23_07460, partial [Planctomycetes bacterium]|nr:hypothetical protein [Planctomycetota bacterium]